VPEAPSAAVYQAASLSKPVFAYLVLKLVGQKVLGLDEPVSRYLPDGYRHRQNLFRLHEPPVEDIVSADLLMRVTVRMLLTHSSGLPNWASSGPLDLAFEPGSRWRYSGEGYVLLQRAVEAATGEPLQELAQRLVFSPLGMRDTSYQLSEAVSARLVGGTAASGKPLQLRFPFAVAAGSLYTSAGDYAAFMAAVLHDQTLVSRIVDGAVPVSRPLGLAWGLGWGVEQTPRGRNLWAWGNNPGYRALAMASVDARRGLVVLTNSENGMPVAKSLVQAALPGEHGALRFEMLQ
jgi:CubicO group peptidase (beta-lactamase class C family)